ncbi:MAG: hypothetical protein JXR83_14560 [Deltaproteobacteria bacterium]|nr:hypothetical protein [Deltaproteobacteria bacterium]
MRRLALAILAAALLVAIAIVALWQHRRRPPAEHEGPSLAALAPELAAERSRAADLLSRYQLVDAEKRRFRIPIERAMAVIVDSPDLLVPTPAASSVSAPATAPASAPTSAPERRER